VSSFLEQLIELRRTTRRMHLSAGDPGATPVTKLGGVPWWPRGIARPRCVADHAMAFMAQIRLADVPGLREEGTMLSFHLCAKCKNRERTHDVRVLQTIATDADAAGTVVPSPIAAATVTFSDVDEVPSPADEPPELRTLPRPELEGGDDPYGLAETHYPGTIHVRRCKLGGWPSWPRQAKWPLAASGKPMRFVAQIDWLVGADAPWAQGGYALLFAEPAGMNGKRRADVVVDIR
jgi:hypothetical protein